MTPQALGKVLIYFGLATVVLGIFLSVAGKVPFFGKLPGDIAIKRDHFTIYFPVTTCLVISILLSLLSRFLGKH